MTLYTFVSCKYLLEFQINTRKFFPFVCRLRDMSILVVNTYLQGYKQLCCYIFMLSPSFFKITDIQLPTILPQLLTTFCEPHTEAGFKSYWNCTVLQSKKSSPRIQAFNNNKCRVLQCILVRLVQLNKQRIWVPETGLKNLASRELEGRSWIVSLQMIIILRS